MKAKSYKLKVINGFCFLLLAACFLPLIAGCGYTIQGKDTLPFEYVKIGRIENKTYEPKLEDRLYKALTDELMKNGFVISRSAGHVISGVINEFHLRPLSEKDGYAVEYEVIVKGRFILTAPDGKTKELRNSGAFIVSFYNAGNIQSIVASKETATDTALKNLASEIRAGIIYQK
ncbi:MAG: LPS assembly lipoprotein LptE [Nitrospiraceae bacterium]|nr:LPS assembly lipoprotein LptE [Nitrospiraceae bacterium]